MSEPRSCFLPDFCAIPFVFAVVVTAELLAVMLTLAAPLQPGQFWGDLSLRSLFVQWIALGATGVLCIARRWLARLGHTRAGVSAWLLILAIAALVTELAVRLAGVNAAPGEHARFQLQTLGIAAIVGALWLRYLYEQHRERQRELDAASARFDALQARIRPHFLFNSMNTIAGLTRADPALAEEVVQDLSDLFRASLADAARLSTLGREIELARGYLHIEAQRLAERLRVTWDLEALPEQAPVPGLLLQPLLENAVYHGIEPDPAGGEIVVSGRYRRGIVNLSVRNSLPADAASERDGNRMAMKNVRDRLAAAFGEAAGLTVGRVDGDYQVRLHFPYAGAGS
jgi:two-component system sensor histidine kinase AlgZ